MCSNYLEKFKDALRQLNEDANNLKIDTNFHSAILKIYELLRIHTEAKNDPVFKSKTQIVANKILGIIDGYHKEVAYANKHRAKERKIIFDKHGDVAIKNNNLSKTIQMKSTHSDSKATTQMFKDAVFQLLGSGGEIPIEGSRRVVDISIHNEKNHWPSKTKKPLWNSSHAEYYEFCEKKITKYLKQIEDSILRYFNYLPKEYNKDDPPQFNTEQKKHMKNNPSMANVYIHNTGNSLLQGFGVSSATKQTFILRQNYIENDLKGKNTTALVKGRNEEILSYKNFPVLTIKIRYEPYNTTEVYIAYVENNNGTNPELITKHLKTSYLSLFNKKIRTYRQLENDKYYQIK